MTSTTEIHKAIDRLESLPAEVRSLVEQAVRSRLERVERERREARQRADDHWNELVAVVQRDIPPPLLGLAKLSRPAEWFGMEPEHEVRIELAGLCPLVRRYRWHNAGDGWLPASVWKVVTSPYESGGGGGCGCTSLEEALASAWEHAEHYQKLLSEKLLSEQREGAKDLDIPF